MDSKKVDFQEDILDEQFAGGEGYTDQDELSGANMAEEDGEGCDNSSEKVADAEAKEQQDWRDKYMRLSAEFDNYRKRTLKEKMELIASGGEDVIKDLLPVMDDIDRALNAMETASDLESMREGVELIAQKFGGMLRAKGVSEIEAMGKPLDTDLHEAIAKVPAPDKKHRGKIVDVVLKGYKLKDKVIRYAKVVVGE